MFQSFKLLFKHEICRCLEALEVMKRPGPCKARAFGVMKDHNRKIYTSTME